MKRFPVLGVLLLVPALMFLGMTGCTKDKGGDKKPAGDDSKAVDKKKPAASGGKVTGAPDGQVHGVVKFDGTAPELKLLVSEIEKNKDKDFCLSGKAKSPWNVAVQDWLVDKSGGVANVVVSLVPVEGKAYDISEKVTEKWKKKVAEVDQPYCAYTPHIVAVYAGVQPLVFKNSASVSHSVKISGGEANGEKEKILSPKVGEMKLDSLVYDRKPIPVACALHGWMTSKIITFKHPYFAVTGDDGSFKIEDVPVGESLRVFIWHESMDKALDTGITVTAKTGEKTAIEGLKISSK